MRTLGWVGVFLLLGIGSVALVPERTAATEAAKCAREFSAGFRDSTPPDLVRHIPLRKLDTASATLCAGWIAHARRHGQTTPDPTNLAAAVRAKPAIYAPLCRVHVQVDLGVNARTYRFVTKAERARYRRDHCRLAVAYFLPDSIAIDRAGLAADHPGLYAPFCASMVLDGAGTAALASLGRRNAQRVARRSCVEALRSGAIECGPAGFVDAKVDENRFDAILARQGL